MSEDEKSDNKFWKNMGIMLAAKLVFVGIGVVITVSYNSSFYI